MSQQEADDAEIEYTAEDLIRLCCERIVRLEAPKRFITSMSDQLLPLAYRLYTSIVYILTWYSIT